MVVRISEEMKKKMEEELKKVPPELIEKIAKVIHRYY